MTKFALFLVFFCIQLSFAMQPETGINRNEPTKKDAAFSLALLNDNYIATWKKDEKGNYFGADDFLTVSILGQYYGPFWHYTFTFQAITSRKFVFRYDLLSLAASKKISVDHYKFEPQLGLIFKGNLGGEKLQNGYHDITRLKKLDYPYSDEKGVAIFLGIVGRWEKQDFLFNSDNASLGFSADLFMDFVPSRFEPFFAYKFEIGKYLQCEILAKGRFYLNRQSGYSEFVRSGIIPAIGVKIKTYQKLYFDAGIAFYPIKNLENDSRYPPYKSSYLPQFWLAFSWNSQEIGLFDYIDY